MQKGAVSNIQDQYKLVSSISCWDHGRNVASTNKLSRILSYFIIF